MNSQDFFASIRNELQQVERQLFITLDTGQPLLKEASEHLIKAGGKRLRPAFVLLSASFFTDHLDELIPMAVSLELVHMATLVHDDVIDNSPSRRGIDTVKAKYGNRISVYSGDYIFAKSLALAAGYNRSDVVEIISDASVRICEGEIIQMETCFDLGQTLKDYLIRIERKTALLMSISCQLGALIAGASPDMIYHVKRYGYYLGMAFQITDDILDFIADETVLGKPTGSDIQQGIITLPVLYALNRSNNAEELKEILSSPEKVADKSERALTLVRGSGGIEYSYRAAERYIEKAQRQLLALPDTEARATLTKLADFVCERDF